MTNRIAIFGATSAIAQSFARHYAEHGALFFLVARSKDRLEAVAADLRTRGAADVTTATTDFSLPPDVGRLCADAESALGTIDIALVAHGELTDQAEAELDPIRLRTTLEVNFVSHVQLLVVLANILERQGSGSLVAIGSVAGDRGKKSNYIYGSAKAGVAVVQQGLIARFHGTGVHALLVKPGFVDTPMTAAFRKRTLWIGPDRAAAAIVRAIAGRRTTIYVPFFWRFIMLGLRALPDGLFVRLGL